MLQCLSLVYVRIFHKPVEDTLECFYQRGKLSVLLIAVHIANTKARKHKEALEDGEQSVDAVVPADDIGARIEFIVCIVAVISELLKNVLISERKGLVLYIDMALSTFLGGT